MSVRAAPWEQFAPLSSIPGLRHGFILRVPGLDLATADKAEALERLRPSHEAALRAMGLAGWPLVWAEQIHGAGIAVLPPDAPVREPLPVPGIDGLVTNQRGMALGIYVADCAAVFLVDPAQRVAGLVHSGRKGTELGITAQAIARMAADFGSAPQDMVAVVSPCIRPPAYEVDFAAEIRRQCREAGIPASSICDAGVCTSREPDRFYSYRMERGKTGRMLAVLGWEP